MNSKCSTGSINSKNTPGASLEKYPNLAIIFGKMAQIQNLLELSIVDSTPESVDQLATAIRPMVEKIAPQIEKLEKNKNHAEVGKLEALTNNKDKIGQLCNLQKINLERAENLGLWLSLSFWFQY